MNADNIFQKFYSDIKDPLWPDCYTLNDFFSLTKDIQLEILQDFMFNPTSKSLHDQIKHIDPNIPNSLTYHNRIKNLIGATNCLMDSRDAIFLYSIIWSKRPSLVLEIGRAYGWSTAIIFGALEDSNSGHLYSIDIKNYIHADIEALVSPRTTLITADSCHLLDLTQLNKNKFQVIFIDGDHSFQATKNDLENSYQLTDKESWILVHDIDIPAVENAVRSWCTTKSDIINCGTYGEKISLLYKSSKF